MIFRRALALVPALLFAPLLVVEWNGDGITPLLRIAGLLVLVISAISPAAGMLVLAGVTPVATQLQVAAHAPMSGAQVAELMVIAFLVAVSVRRSLDPDLRPTRLGWPALVAGVVVVAAGLVQLGVEQQSTTVSWWTFLVGLLNHVAMKYFSDFSAFAPLHLTMVWIEALLLALSVERLLRQKPSLGISATRIFLIGTAAAASCAAIRLFEASARTPSFWAALVQYVRSLRLNPHYPDLNAAGSYYLLGLVPAVWLALKRRLWLWPFSGVTALALWLSGSRAAMVTGVLTLAVAWVVERRPRLRTLVVAGLITVVAAFALMRPRATLQPEAGLTMRLRGELMMVGVRMAIAHPAFGVGPGQFREAASTFVTPWLLKIIPVTGGVENAHNQFIQILAELGTVGLLAFVWMLIAPGRAIARSVGQKTAPPELIAMAWGLVAFLVSSLLGHPLLTTQVLFAFFLAIGITAGLVPEPAPAPGRRLTGLVAVAVALLAVSVPFRIDAARRAAFLDNVMIGVSGVRDTLDNVRYRAVEPRAVWFVAATTQSATLPLRQAPGTTTPCRVSVTVDGASVTEASPTAEQWLRVELPLPAPARWRASRAIGVTSGDGCQLIAGPLVKR